MPSSYTSNLRLTLPATGELSGTWGSTVNTGITSLVDTSIAGTASITMTAGNYTLSSVNGGADEARSMILSLGGTPGGSYNVICPAVSKLYVVVNGTGHAQTLKTAAGSGISVPDGKAMLLRCDGTDVVDALTNFTSLAVNNIAVATLSAVQTLTNKTINGPDNTLTNIGNASLVNSSVTVGSTNIALGATSTTLAGLTGVTSSTFTNSSLTAARVVFSNAGGVQTDSANLTFNGTVLTAGGFSGPLNGSVGLSSPSTGSFTVVSISTPLGVPSGGTGLGTTPTNGQLLIGNGSNYSLATITQGFGVSITNGAGSITIGTNGEIFSGPIVTATADYTVAAGVSNIINNKTGSTLVLTLPTPSTCTGREITVQNYQAQLVESSLLNVVQIGGVSTQTTILEAVVGNWATIVSNGVDWVIMRRSANNNLLIE
jgi:hypothetical protein